MNNCCFNCWYYRKGVCTNEKFVAKKPDFTKYIEDGYLSESIKEGFTDTKFSKVKSILDGTRLSKATKQEILNAISEELDDAIINWTESIDEQVSLSLKNFDFATNGLEMNREFVCAFYR